MFRNPVAFVSQLLNVPRQFHRPRNGPSRGLTYSRRYQIQHRIGKDCAVACTVVVLRVRPRLCGATAATPPSAAARVISNLCVTVIAPSFALRCECALRSFEIAELLLLFGAENVENLGLHAGVRDDQPCQQTCFCIGESFDLLCI